jgi:metallo-beta-lactamase family protein
VRNTPVLTFLGGAGTVTGSKFLVDTEGTRVLVDAGLYQGLSELRRRNWQELPVPADTIDAVVLTHAHLDHSGYLPRLVKDGFAGPILCTEETGDLATIVLRDSAHLQEEDAEYANQRGYSKHRPALPLYDSADVEKTLPLLTAVPYGERRSLGPDVHVTLSTAGHILGSATVLLEAAGARVLFSGDLGRHNHPLLRPPADPPGVDVAVVESTYGDRRHPVADPDVLADAIRRTAKRGGSILIPAFAVDRTELVLLELDRLTRTGAIPRLPVFVDSPMALSTLEVYLSALRSSSSQLRPDVGEALEALEGGQGLQLHRVSRASDSEALNDPDYPCIVISASGMATGGRVVHHLEHQLPDPRNCVALTGYQAVGTRGRQLLEGATHLKMHGRYVPVRAEVVEVQSFSVHADADETLQWLGRCPTPPRVTYVVHGEPEASSALARRISSELGWDAIVPKYGERVRLD